jgi:hypothetical protein
MFNPFHVDIGCPIIFRKLGEKTKARTHPMSEQELSADRRASAIRPSLIQA